MQNYRSHTPLTDREVRQLTQEISSRTPMGNTCVHTAPIQVPFKPTRNLQTFAPTIRVAQSLPRALPSLPPNDPHHVERWIQTSPSPPQLVRCPRMQKAFKLYYSAQSPVPDSFDDHQYHHVKKADGTHYEHPYPQHAHNHINSPFYVNINNPMYIPALHSFNVELNQILEHHAQIRINLLTLQDKIEEAINIQQINR